MTGTNPWPSVTALAMAGIRSVVKSKLVWFALAFSAVHIGIRIAVVVFAALIGGPFLEQFYDAAFFRDTIMLQVLPMTVVLAMVGARITAQDRMMGGLEFILSKGIPAWGYAAGRALAPFIAVVATVLVPVALFVGLLPLLVEDLPSDAARLGWGALGMGTLFAVVFGPLAAGIGTLVRNPRRATAVWLVAVWLTVPLAAFADEFGADWWWAISPIDTVQAVGETMLGLPFPAKDAYLWLAWVEVAALTLVPLVLLHLRTREVVK